MTPIASARSAWRGLYDQPAEEATGYLDDLADNLTDPDMAPELRQLGRTLHRWRTEIVAPSSASPSP